MNPVGFARSSTGMFATRVMRAAFTTAARTFAPASRPTQFTSFQTSRGPLSRNIHPSPSQWRSTFRLAQQRTYASYNYRRFGGSRAAGSLLRRWAARPTFYYEVGGIGGVCGGYYIYNLERVPVSGRRRFNIISPQYEEQAGQAQYEQTLSQFGKSILPHYTKEHQMVQRVLDRLVPHSGLENEKWEVHVIDDDMKNAFVIPGGKVFVFRGILDICQGDDGLAAVLGHEIAHNVAHHMAERLSEMYILAPVSLAISVLGGIDYRLIDTVGNLALSLPHSRRQEEEADYIGLLMMAESCYDPSAAVGLWTRMEQAEQGSPPQFLSTHPSSHNRMEKIRSWLPEAQQKSETNDCHVTSGYGLYNRVQSLGLP
ncbi:peptidase family M48-domain-containing protein [Neohortaea acidophila]|uniref:Peptidase family M48-domain-containing protein n=1 Tax=Neohortaea acidophila TaxID=245834 RepID=A0A6A6PPU7_9PEZI|nr:peptidase family M48-domain-containing protein [Neohortaea acidophila]KAF2481701.1 peptidase family M48-domain-containing protein [Neohortaea acidophila]